MLKLYSYFKRLAIVKLSPYASSSRTQLTATEIAVGQTMRACGSMHADVSQVSPCVPVHLLVCGSVGISSSRHWYGVYRRSKLCTYPSWTYTYRLQVGKSHMHLIAHLNWTSNHSINTYIHLAPKVYRSTTQISAPPQWIVMVRPWWQGYKVSIQALYTQDLV